MTIKRIIAWLLSLIEGWKPNNSIGNDIEDAILALNGAQNAGIITAPLGGAFFKTLTKDAASFENLKSGQLAQGFTVGAEFDGVADKVLIFGVRQYVGLTPPAGSPAETLKNLEGY